jgi:hypothetical protein
MSSSTYGADSKERCNTPITMLLITTVHHAERRVIRHQKSKAGGRRINLILGAPIMTASSHSSPSIRENILRDPPPRRDRLARFSPEKNVESKAG